MELNKTLIKDLSGYIAARIDAVRKAEIKFSYIKQGVVNGKYTYDDVNQYFAYVKDEIDSGRVIDKLYYPELTASIKEKIDSNSLMVLNRPAKQKMDDSEILAVFYYDIYYLFQW